jgi:hypothetical protein
VVDVAAVKVLRGVVLGVGALVAVMGGAFLIAETVGDPDRSAAIIVVAVWAVVTVAFSAWALRRPVPASPALSVVGALVAVFVVLDAALGVVPDTAGPVGAIAVFAVAVPLGCLAVHRPVQAGVLLVLVGAVSLNAALWTRSGSPGGSLGVVAVTTFVFGAMFLGVAAAERLGHRAPHLKP